MKKKNLHTAIKFKSALKLFGVVMLFSSVSASIFAQENVVLHSEVGDTIDVIEKIDYMLFSNIPDSTFSYAVIFQDKGAYQLSVFNGDKTIVSELSQQAFKENAQNVEKLSTYYKRKLEKDSNEGASVLVKKDSIPLGLDIDWMSAKQKKKMIKESSRYNSLKLDADELGLMGFERENYIKTGGQVLFLLSE